MPTSLSEKQSSVDPQEAARYSALADTWWDPKGPFWPLHRLNKLRVVYIREKLSELFQRDSQTEKPLTGLRTLDIGCGGGILSESMAALGANVHGIDVVERNILIASHHSQQSGLPIYYETVTAEALAEQGVQYDVVLNMEVVEHVANLAGFMAACTQLVRPHGVMFVATINRNLWSWITAIVGAEYILRWLPRGTHQWRRFPKPHELEALLHKGEMQVIARQGVRVNPFTKRMALTDFLGVNYMLVAIKKP
jgi:2-polyprenyl-6-hydroxyphenyl methylase/3-demethylubiquinone-9 3-methyltransferase